ncbi:MAG: thioredoxin domain-containing protein [Desulfobacterota bacterium]|nr:thioredoxin domain-containing protein [Thermodesulfobacteriota bacterium]
MEPKYTNRLIHETSPYLLQHAHNPVDWYPWGEEALSRARKEDKPILLSIGYSACHWCHVMEKESFENEAIARIMNEHFINIKVDREERPDLDELYMNALQALTGSGGWPMTVFLTPQLVPFHAGTYFPPEDRMGMPGFPRVLLTVANYYRTHRGEVSGMERQMEQVLQQIVKIEPSKSDPDPHLLAKAFEAIEGQFDPVNGGFGRAPKFPNSMALSFLLKYWKRNGERKALRIVETTLEKMANGGIYDHLGGGFHRYSVDERWLIPHFEKMLYDNALLSRTYFEAFQATRREGFLRIGEEILDYVLREMKAPEGGFFSTQDADSEGEEGKFYVWTRDEIKAILGREEGTAFCAYYGVTPQGNFEGGRSVLHVSHPLEKVSELYSIPVEELEILLREGRKKLFLEREKRVRPGRDEKVLTSWNGLMISSLTDGFKLTGKASYLKAAEEAARFILEGGISQETLMRVYNRGRWQVKGYSEDYAFFIQALIDLYEATFDLKYLRQAYVLNERFLGQFWDEKEGGFFFTGSSNERLIARSKHPYDQAIPSPNAIGLTNLLRLGHLTGEGSLKKKGEEILRLFYDLLSEHPIAFPQMLSGFFLYLYPEEIGLLGPKDDPKTKKMAQVLYQAFIPNKILAHRDPKESIEGDWFPFLKGREIPPAPTVYVCRGFTCLPPVQDEEELKKIFG